MAMPGGLRLRPTTAFGRDLKRVGKRGNDLDRLHDVIERLRTGAALEPRHRDHASSGDRKGWRDCYLEPNWLLINRVDEDAGALILGRTGTHADLLE
jgi:mRNA interferase YafQ